MNNNVMIYMYSDRRFRAAIVFCLSAIVTLLSLAGCGSDEIGVTTGIDGYEGGTMSLRAGIDPEFVENTSIYVFTNSYNFVEKKLNVNKQGNVLSTYMPVGTWNLALVSCNFDVTGLLSVPAYGASAASSPMWVTPTDAMGFLTQTPEQLLYASLPDTEILPNAPTAKQTAMERNVAKIQFILKEYSGFDEISTSLLSDPNAYIDLLNVPTTLNWKGEYYPDKVNPTHSGSVPIREQLRFQESTPGGPLVADTVNFIIPAHRGDDAFSAVHNDTTTHKLRFRASMPLNGQPYYGKTSPTPVEIKFSPKINRIIQVELTFRGEPDTDLDIKIKVKDWGTTDDQNEEFD